MPPLATARRPDRGNRLRARLWDALIDALPPCGPQWHRVATVYISTPIALSSST